MPDYCQGSGAPCLPKTSPRARSPGCAFFGGVYSVCVCGCVGGCVCLKLGEIERECVHARVRVCLCVYAHVFVCVYVRAHTCTYFCWLLFGVWPVSAADTDSNFCISRFIFFPTVNLSGRTGHRYTETFWCHIVYFLNNIIAHTQKFF